MLRVFAFILICLSWLPFSQAQTDELAAIYGARPNIEYAEISPEGEQMAFIQNSGAEVNLIIYSLQEMAPTARIPIEDLKVRGVEWASERRVILHVSDTTQHYNWARGRFEYSAAYVIDLRSGDFRQLVIGTDGVWSGQGGLGRIVGFSDDGNYAFMPIRVRLPNRSEPSLTLLQVSLSHGRGVVSEYGQLFTRDFLVNDAGDALARENYNYENDSYELQVPGRNDSW